MRTLAFSLLVTCSALHAFDVQEGFESPGFTANDSLGSYSSWSVTQGSAIITTAAAHGGSQSVKLNLNSPATIVNRTVPTPSSGIYYTDLWIKPVAESGGLAHVSIDGVEITFLLLTNSPSAGVSQGQVIVADGANTRVLVTNQTLTTGNQFSSWLRLTVRHSIESELFDIFVDGVLKAIDVTADTDSAPLGTLKVYGTVATPVYIDDFRFSSSHPLFTDSDSDGMPDSWETSQGLITNGEHARDDDPDEDDLSNIGEYLAGANPLAADTDSDGMEDAYEAANGLRANDADDKLEDRDGDRVPNLWEYKKNTLAGDKTDVPDPDYIVDPAHGADSTTDNIYSTITAAVGASPTISAQPTIYPLIQIVAARYVEELNIPSSKRVAMYGVAGLQRPVIQPTYWSAYFNSPLIVLNGLEFVQNPAYNSGEVLNFGPASGSSMHMSNCLVRGSTTSGYGIFSSAGNLTLAHCTIFGFKSSSSGVGLQQSYVNGWTTIRNSIVWNAESSSTSQVYTQYGNRITVANSIIKGGTGGATNVDPLLNGLGDLTGSSPAINAGSTPIREGADIHGEDRNSPPDLGADEFIDSDDDDLQDGLEELYFSDLDESGGDDSDEDDLTNLEEQTLGTDWSDSDTDDDGLEDGAEIDASASPFLADTDSDGMGDAYEATNGLRANDATDKLEDRDGDQVPNFWESKKSTSAGSNTSVPDPDYIVDPAHGADSTSDNIYSTIMAAIGACPTISAQPTVYPLIRIVSARYVEEITVPSSKRVAIYGVAGLRRPVIQPTYWSAYFNSPLIILNGLEFVQNPAYNSGEVLNFGPASGSSMHMTNCLVHGSTTSGYGIFTSAGNLTLAHCTIFGFKSSASGVGLQQSYVNGWTTIRNSIVWNAESSSTSQVYTQYGNRITVANSIIKGGAGGGTNTDPLLNGLGELTGSSPAINAGSTPIREGADMHGESRTSAPDLGADEFVDSDEDGLQDGLEELYFSDLDEDDDDDSDADGLTNLEEQNLGTDWSDSDTDDDGLEDGAEIDASASPFIADTDGDGMGDAYEATNGLRANDAADKLEDRDGDLVPNLWECKKSTLAGTKTSVPDPDYIVDPAHGADSTTDNIYSTISAAVSACPTLSGAPTAYPLIRVVAGSYSEAPDFPDNKRLALIGATGGSRSILNQPSGDPIYIYSPLMAMVGFEVVQHASYSGNLFDLSGASIWSTIRISNCLVRGQSTSGRAFYNFRTYLTLVHCTVTGFQASSAGVSVLQSDAYGVPYGNTFLRNIIFWNSGASGAELSGPGITVANCLIRGGTGGAINSNPLLDSAGRPTYGSPAIDVAVEPPFHRADIAGNSRVDAPELGAYECADDDADGMRDIDEMHAFGTLAYGATDDPDSDGLTNAEEQTYGTGLNDADSDDDGMADGWEFFNGLDPNSSDDAEEDSDEDGLDNLGEFTHSSNPNAIDTDLDGMPDGWEVLAGLDPANDGDASLDADSDGLSNFLEFDLGCDANEPDTDGDDMPDGWEHEFELNPLNDDDAEDDSDEDGLDNLDEYTAGTDPTDADSDDDGMPDGWEVLFGFDPLSADDATDDPDSDGLNNLGEFNHGTDPLDADSDGDTLSDGSEVTAGWNPTEADSDFDGLDDGLEDSLGTDGMRADSDGDGISDFYEHENGTDPLEATPPTEVEANTGLLLLTPAPRPF